MTELATETPLVTIGEVTVTAHWVVTPQGTVKATDATWTVTPMLQRTRNVPAWAIVAACVGAFFFLLGLLFLLVKEERTVGRVQVIVTGPGIVYAEFLPVFSQVQADEVVAKVSYARSLALAAA